MDVSQRKPFSVVSAITPNVLACDARKLVMKEDTINHAIEKRRQQEVSGETGNFSKLQLATVPEPIVGMRIDFLFNHADDVNDEDTFM